MATVLKPIIASQKLNNIVINHLQNLFVSVISNK